MVLCLTFLCRPPFTSPKTQDQIEQTDEKQQKSTDVQGIPMAIFQGSKVKRAQRVYVGADVPADMQGCLGKVSYGPSFLYKSLQAQEDRQSRLALTSRQNGEASMTGIVLDSLMRRKFEPSLAPNQPNQPNQLRPRDLLHQQQGCIKPHYSSRANHGVQCFTQDTQATLQMIPSN